MLEVSNMEDWEGEFEEAEMTWTFFSFLVASLALQRFVIGAETHVNRPMVDWETITLATVELGVGNGDTTHFLGV